MSQKICVVGLGYVGLPIACLAATRGHSVIGVDTNTDRIQAINQTTLVLEEPDFDQLLKNATCKHNFLATHQPNKSDIFIIAVPTPLKDDKSPDVSYVDSAIESIIPVLEKHNLIIIESTCPVGTTERVFKTIQLKRPDLFDQDISSIDMAYCPERILPGNIIYELLNNDRIIGGLFPTSTVRASTFYQSIIKGQCLSTDCRTAELAKLAENAYRDINIAYANELDMLCESYDIDVRRLIELTNHHPRVNILEPGPGVGGHCIAIDPWFIVYDHPQNARLIKTAREVNIEKTNYVVRKIYDSIQNNRSLTLGILGLAYKANVGDTRESPSQEVIKQLLQKTNCDILVHDPYLKKLPSHLATTSRIQWSNLELLVKKSDIIVGLVNHHQYKYIKSTQLKDKIIIDTQSMWSK